MEPRRQLAKTFGLASANGATGASDMAGNAARVAVERSGKLPRYKPDCHYIKPQTSDIKSATGLIRRGEHGRVCGL
jgi:hypothetical protein